MTAKEFVEAEHWWTRVGSVEVLEQPALRKPIVWVLLEVPLPWMNVASAMDSALRVPVEIFAPVELWIVPENAMEIVWWMNATFVTEMVPLAALKILTAKVIVAELPR